MIGNGAQRFKVIYAEVVRAKLRQLAEAATNAGKGPAFLATLKKLDHRLKKLAATLGEPLYTLKHSSIEVRIGGAENLMVRYGLLREKNIVVVIECCMLGDSGF